MAELGIIPDLFPSTAMAPPRSARNAPAASASAPPTDQVELSPEALDDRQIRDAILMKIAMEGKDFHTARREVLKERAAESHAAAKGSPEPHTATHPDQALDFELTAIQVTHVEAEVTTPTSHLELEATRIEVIHVGLTSRQSAQKQDPLVIDMGGSGPQTTGSEAARSFDLSGSGTAAPTSFVQDDSAFLALDRDGDGRIGSGRELFGDQHGAQDGYEELRKFDADQNGRIDAGDPVYSSLQLLYGDERQVSLAASGIRSISLEAYAAGQTTAAGDEVLRSGTAEMTDGRHLQTYAMAIQTFDASA